MTFQWVTIDICGTESLPSEPLNYELAEACEENWQRNYEECPKKIGADGEEIEAFWKVE